MNIFIEFCLKLYSDLIELSGYINKNLENVPYYRVIINILIKYHSYVFEYHVDPDLPFNSKMYLNKNLKLIINYDDCFNSQDFYNGYDYKLILNKFNLNDKDYTQTKLIKYNENYDMNINIDHVFNSEKSKFKFLAVQYIHPDMEDKLTFNLDKSYLSIGNDILDNIFIKYFLSKHFKNDEYKFDENYSINIIAEDCNFYTLDNNTYIHFNDDKWSINKKNKDNNIQN